MLHKCIFILLTLSILFQSKFTCLLIPTLETPEQKKSNPFQTLLNLFWWEVKLVYCHFVGSWWFFGVEDIRQEMHSSWSHQVQTRYLKLSSLLGLLNLCCLLLDNFHMIKWSLWGWGSWGIYFTSPCANCCFVNLNCSFSMFLQLRWPENVLWQREAWEH
jgi:hypothetical protein